MRPLLRSRAQMHTSVHSLHSYSRPLSPLSHARTHARKHACKWLTDWRVQTRGCENVRGGKRDDTEGRQSEKGGGEKTCDAKRRAATKCNTEALWRQPCGDKRLQWRTDVGQVMLRLLPTQPPPPA
ncbi:uncharacterized protein LOC144022035 isoform X2 [Festucalex cinctus]